MSRAEKENPAKYGMRNYMKLLEGKAEPADETPEKVVEAAVEVTLDPIAEAYRASISEDEFLAETVLEERGLKAAAAALAITGLMGGAAAWATGVAANSAMPSDRSANVLQSNDLALDDLEYGDGNWQTYMDDNGPTPTDHPEDERPTRAAPPPQLVARAQQGRAIDRMPTEFRQEWAYLALTIWGEARGEDRSGMLAVGNVMQNRVKQGRWGDDIRSVVTQSKQGQNGIVYQFSCWGDSNRESMMEMYQLDRRLAGLLNSNPREYQRLMADLKSNTDFQAWLQAKDIAYKILAGRARDNTGGANHYHTTGVNPSWNSAMERTAKVGDHLFFTDRA